MQKFKDLFLILCLFLVKKPLKPADFDEEAARSVLLDHMSKYQRKPGAFF